MDENELTQYINVLQERDRWMAAYETLFITNEEHIRQRNFYKSCLEPQHPCNLENDEPFDDMVQDDEDLWDAMEEYERHNPNNWTEIDF
jgi:hypothetical protein